MIYEGEPTEPLEPGRVVKVRGYAFTIPEMTLGERERLEDKGWFDKPYEAGRINKIFTDAQGRGDPDSVLDQLREDVRKKSRESTKAMCEIIATVMRRNYSKITPEWVKDNFSQSEILKAFSAAMGTEETALTRPGEAQAAVSPAASNGARSTLS